MRAGNAKPRADRQRAPNKDMNNSKLGIATASKTEMKRSVQIEAHRNINNFLALTCYQNQ